MSYSFQQALTRDGSITIDINLKEHITNVNINLFIKSYKISNLWKGKFFIKRLINKIFKYQLMLQVAYGKKVKGASALDIQNNLPI